MFIIIGESNSYFFDIKVLRNDSYLITLLSRGMIVEYSASKLIHNSTHNSPSLFHENSLNL